MDILCYMACEYYIVTLRWDLSNTYVTLFASSLELLGNGEMDLITPSLLEILHVYPVIFHRHTIQRMIWTKGDCCERVNITFNILSKFNWNADCTINIMEILLYFPF